MPNRLLRSLAVTALLAGLSAVPMSPAEAAPRTTLTVGIRQYPSSLHPLIEAMTAKEYVLGFGRRYLTVHDKDWKLTCQLCTEVPSVENGRAKYVTRADGKPGVDLTYTIRPEAKWGDGTPITSKDAKFTWDVGRSPTTGADNYTLFSRDIVGVEIKDEKTFTLQIAGNLCDFGWLNDFRLLPEHIERAAFEMPGEYRTRTKYDSEPTNPGLWSGPYIPTKVERGSMVVFERNPNWWGERPQFDRIVVKAIENTAALQSNVVSGDVDFLSGEIALTLDQALKFQDQYKDRFVLQARQALAFEHLDVNHDNPILGDLRVRKALLLSLDREAISKQIFRGEQPISATSKHPKDLYFDPSIKPYPVDRAAAVKLLEEAGWTEIGPDKIRRNKAGDKLQFELLTTTGNKTRELVQQVMQQQWKLVGVEVRIRNEPARVFFGETTRHRKFPGMVLFAWTSSPGLVPQQILSSSDVPSEANAWSGQNYGGYKSAKMDDALNRAKNVCTPAENKQAWYDVQRIYSEELPALPLYHEVNPQIQPKWLKHVDVTGNQYSSSLWVEQWRAEEEGK